MNQNRGTIHTRTHTTSARKLLHARTYRHQHQAYTSTQNVIHTCEPTQHPHSAHMRRHAPAHAPSSVHTCAHGAYNVGLPHSLTQMSTASEISVKQVHNFCSLRNFLGGRPRKKSGMVEQKSNFASFPGCCLSPRKWSLFAQNTRLSSQFRCSTSTSTFAGLLSPSYFLADKQGS